MDVMGNLVVLAVLIALSAFFSCVELALVSVSHIKVRSFLEEGRRGADALHRLKHNSRRMLVTILVGGNIVSIAAASLAAIITTDVFGSAGLGIATGAMTLLMLVFGDIIPKTFATAHSGRISLATAGMIEMLGYVLYPIVILFEHVSTLTMKMINVKKLDAVTKSEIKAMIDYGAEEMVIDPEEKAIMQRAMKFSETTAEDVMTPFEKVFCLNGSHTIKQCFDRIADSGFSRIPVYSGRAENMTGVLFVKSVLKAMEAGKGGIKLKNIAASPIFVSRKTHMDRILELFRKKQMHIALVKESGKTVGLVTIEDLLEKLIGHMAW